MDHGVISVHQRHTRQPDRRTSYSSNTCLC